MTTATVKKTLSPSQISRLVKGGTDYIAAHFKNRKMEDGWYVIVGDIGYNDTNRLLVEYIVYTNDDVFDGEFCGVITVNDDMDIEVSFFPDTVILPALDDEDGNPIY